MVFSSYICSTVSGLHVDTSYYPQLSLNPKYWSFKDWISTLLNAHGGSMAMAWHNKENGVSAATDLITNCTWPLTYQMKAVIISFHLDRVWGSKSSLLEKRKFTWCFACFIKVTLHLKLPLIWNLLYCFLVAALALTNDGEEQKMKHLLRPLW